MSIATVVVCLIKLARPTRRSSVDTERSVSTYLCAVMVNATVSATLPTRKTAIDPAPATSFAATTRYMPLMSAHPF